MRKKDREIELHANLERERATSAARLCRINELQQQNAVMISLVADIRFALGDDGKRMQAELVEYCKELRRDAALGKAINRACGDLPAECEITIELENGAGSASLYRDGEKVDIDYDDDTFAHHINRLIDAAMQTQAPKGA